MVGGGKAMARPTHPSRGVGCFRGREKDIWDRSRVNICRTCKEKLTE